MAEVNVEEFAAQLGTRPINRPSDEDLARERWLEQRRGKITCSRFGDLIGKGRGKSEVFTATGYSYLRGVIAERLGSTIPSSDNFAMRHGRRYESDAMAEYGKRPGCGEPINNPNGFIEFNSLVGGTPDFLVEGELSGVGEIKCPYNPAVHIETLQGDKVPDKHLWQCHGHMLLTGADYCDFVSFDPRMEGEFRLFVKRLERDEKAIEALRSRLALATEYVTKAVDLIVGERMAAKVVEQFESLGEYGRKRFMEAIENGPTGTPSGNGEKVDLDVIA